MFLKDATCGAGSAYTSGAAEITPVFGVVHVAYSLVFYVVSCVLLVVFFFFNHGVVSLFSIYESGIFRPSFL